MFYSFIKIILKPFFKLYYLYKVKNKPKDLPQKNLIICANHVSMMDPIMLALATDRQIHFMAKKEIYDSKILAFLLNHLNAFPVDRGHNDIDAVRQSIKVLRDDKLLGIFPEGTRIRDGKPDRANFKDGVAMIATKTNSDILPVRIKGKYGLFSELEIIYKDIIKIDDFDKTDKKNLYKNVMDEVYNRIFDEDFK